MTKDLPTVLDYSRAGLLITAHGSPSTSGGGTSTRKHADTIRKLSLFADVRAGFLTEKPFAKDVLDDFDTPEVYVMPNLACAGFITTTKLPQALSLTGTVTERITPSGRQRVFLTDPVGTDPAIAKTFAIRICAAMDELSINQDDAAVVVIGHGSQRSRASFEHTTVIAGELSRHGINAPIFTSFLEEKPFIKDWRAQADAKNIVFAPFLISDGYHGSDEIPREIGFDIKADDFTKRLGAIQPNELTVNGQRLVYLPPLGDVPEMADLILMRVRAAQSAAA